MKKKKKQLNAIIRGTIYPFDIMLSINESNEEFVNNLAKYEIDTDDYELIHIASSKTKKGRTVMLDTNQVIIRLNTYPTSCEDYGILQHEIFHSVDFILYKIGLRLSRKSDEAYAYFIGYLTTEIYKLI